MSSYHSCNRKKKSKQQGYGSYACNMCEDRVLFTTREALMAHKAEKRANDPESHIHCKFCGDDFITTDAEKYHTQEYHPNPQELTCPACGKGPFTRVAALAQHIERNECTKLNMSELQALRDQKAQFAQRLVALTNAPLKNHFTDYMPTSQKSPPGRYDGWDDVSNVDKYKFRPAGPGEAPDDGEDGFRGIDEQMFSEEFPQLGGGMSRAAESVAPDTESVVDSNIAAAESDAGASQAAFARLPPHLRSPKPAAPASTASNVSVAASDAGEHQAASARLPPHLRGPRPSIPPSITGSTSTITTDKKTSFVPPHLRGPKKNGPEAARAGSFVVEPKVKGKENIATGWVASHLRGSKPPTSASTTTVDPGDFPKPDEKPATSIPAWTTNKNLFPNAPPAQVPKQPQLQAATSFNPNYRAWLDVDHPEHPQFSYGRYWCPYSNAYMCPKVRCGKAFKKHPGLIGHLRGPAHSDKKYTCPSCHKDFASLEAVTAHSESASQRCGIRHTDGYNAYLDQLTSGIVDLAVTDHDDGTHKYETSVAAMRLWGNAETADKTEQAREAEKAKREEEKRKKDEAKKTRQTKDDGDAKRAAEFKAGLDALTAESKQTREQTHEQEGEEEQFRPQRSFW